MTPGFHARPFAHRALHAPGRAENSPAAIEAAIAAGYGIEIDLQLSRDHEAMVFHDYDLSRLTGARGPVRQRDAADLGALPLSAGGGTIPTLPQVLDLVAGRVPLLIELKDQDGALGPDIGPLEEATARALAQYEGPAALMSFNPHAVARMAELCPDRPRGLTTCAFRADDWPTVPAATRDRLAAIPDCDSVGASFISHDVKDLKNPAVMAIKSTGIPVYCWTVRSAEAEAEARKVADQITFEGYRP